MIAGALKDYLDRARAQLPEGVELHVIDDESEELRARLGTLARTTASGFILVLISLALVLRFRLAVWVALGMPIALLGALAFFPVAGYTLSLMAIIGFLLVLGIVVDDAIVVGERVYATRPPANPRKRRRSAGRRRWPSPSSSGCSRAWRRSAPCCS